MTWRKGMKVRLIWAIDAKDPPVGTHGRVAPMMLPGKGRSCTAGPLIYVEWQNGQYCGVLRGQVERVE